MDHFVLAVSMSGLIQSFPGVSKTVLMYLLTVGTLAAVAGSFAFSFLSARYTKKNLSVISLVVGCGCALLYLLFPDRLPVLFAAGAGLGLVSGAIATAFPLLVNVHVRVEERGGVMGTGSGMIQFGRLTTFLLAGFLANIQWNLVYFVYGFMLAALLVIIFLLPQDVLPQKSPGSRSEAGPKGAGGLANPWLKAAKNAGIWQLTAIVLLYGIVQFPASSHISLYIEGYGLGLPSMTGLLTAVSCGLGGFVSVLFAPVYRVTGKRTYFFVFVAIGAGFIFAGSWVSLTAILLGLAFCTAASAICLPYTLLRIPDISDAETVPLITALIPTLINIGSFISPILLNLTASAFGGGTPADIYRYGGILSVGVAVFVFLFGNQMTLIRNETGQR
jgi:MFS family permease